MTTQAHLAKAVLRMVTDPKTTIGAREASLLLVLDTKGKALTELGREAKFGCRHNLTGRLGILRKKGLAQVIWKRDGKTRHALSPAGEALVTAMVTAANTKADP